MGQGECHAFYGSDCSARSGPTEMTEWTVPAAPCTTAVAATTLENCQHLCMMNPLGCGSFNWAKTAGSSANSNEITNRCEHSPASAATPDPAADDGHRGYAYDVKWFSAGTTPQQAYCGGPYRGNGSNTLQKDLAACKTHCTALGDRCREFRWFDDVVAAAGSHADDGDGTCYTWTGECEKVVVRNAANDADEPVGVIYRKRDLAPTRLTPHAQWDYYEAIFTPKRDWGGWEASAAELTRPYPGGLLQQWKSGSSSGRTYDVRDTDGPYCLSAAGNSMVVIDTANQ